MGQYLNELNDDLVNRRQVWVWDDFVYYTDATTFWTKGGTSSTVGSLASSVNGIVQLQTNTAANAEAWVAATNKFWLFAAGKPLVYECRINYQEQNTNNAGIFCGFASNMNATGFLQNTTLTPNTSFSGCGIYKQAGDTTWRCITSVGSTQVLSPTSNTASSQSTDTVLRVEVKIVGANVEVDFLIGNDTSSVGSPSITNSAFNLQAFLDPTYLKPIKHRVAFSGAAYMTAGVFLKGASSTAEKLNWDYVGFANLR